MNARGSSPPAVVNLDPYVLDTLMRDLIRHDHSSSGFVVYLHLWRQSLGAGVPTVRISLRDIAEATGLSKRGVQQALANLARRQLVTITRRTITDVPVYAVNRPWLARGHRTR